MRITSISKINLEYIRKFIEGDFKIGTYYYSMYQQYINGLLMTLISMERSDEQGGWTITLQGEMEGEEKL
ncbi:MAG TPA: hypothetical protein VFG10_14225 [Saprospiraceae bacterium]|nr:hypothetical protein [Saprospiraceae bacterium]